MTIAGASRARGSKKRCSSSASSHSLFVRVMTRVTAPDGEPAWMGALGGGLVPEADADAYIARQVGRDPDLWVVEVDDPKGRHPFEGRML